MLCVATCCSLFRKHNSTLTKQNIPKTLKSLLSLNFKMAPCILCQIFLILLTFTKVVHASESNRHLDQIHFVLVNGNGPVVAMPANASVIELHGAIAESYNISFPFELHLFGETIVSPRSPTNQPLESIPRIISIAKDLDEIYGPGFRIPLKLHPLVPSEEDFTAFASLAQMFGGSDSNIHEFEWYRFVRQCLESRSCLIQDLCDNQFGKFFCRKGQLITIILSKQKIKGHLDLSAIPHTVTKILMERNLLTQIIGLDRLAGTKLRYLDIRQNPLKIDLNLLHSASQSSESSPLKTIKVSFNQISQSLIGKSCKHICDEVYQAATAWIESSSLESIVIGRHARYIRRQR